MPELHCAYGYVMQMDVPDVVHLRNTYYIDRYMYCSVVCDWQKAGMVVVVILDALFALVEFSLENIKSLVVGDCT